GIIVFTYGASCSALTSTASSPSARRNAAIAAEKVFSLTPFGRATYDDELGTAPPRLQVDDERGEARDRKRRLAGALTVREGARDGRPGLRGEPERGACDGAAHALDPVAGSRRERLARGRRRRLRARRRRRFVEERFGDREGGARRGQRGRQRRPGAPCRRGGDPDVAQRNGAVRRARVAAAREQAPAL